ncbi:MAG: hypothetical protein F4060_03130 [Holophagales bacterium]|nr:hypothetical protein [Holophagales bacterium]MYG31319.1 hypothetical protein [Holophagales bacterium]MYI78913.1 hypothetical protein [Holophagales bacterium]
MKDGLSSWQARFERHFGALKGERTGPVFGLEHGLTEREVQTFAVAVRESLQVARPSERHWLAWVVYSAELGYRYAGDEYWQTFEAATPGWAERGERVWIRDYYRRFHREFDGAMPSGRWAEHFSIICWPITHSVLPKDLQRQFARVLHAARYSFTAAVFEEPSVLGRLIEARSWNTTARFQHFVQETELVGRIASALLAPQFADSGGLIHDETLQRISTDLNAEQRAREWLRGARRSVRERVQVRGLRGVPHGGRSGGVNDLSEARAAVARLGIEPRAFLRPLDPDRHTWAVALEIPDLSGLLARFPDSRDVLAGCRCAVAGRSGRPLARGRLLYGAQRVVLDRWPRSDEVLLQFEQTNSQLEFLLRTECLLRPGRSRVFRIASDGLAYESRTHRVRAGSSYIVASTEGGLAACRNLERVELRCDGLDGAVLKLPRAMTPAYEETLNRLGLEQTKTIEVWPAGLAPVAWDGEGYGEWFATEQPCLGLRADYPIGELSVSLSGEQPSRLDLGSVSAGQTVFVELPKLPVGRYGVRVSCRASGNGSRVLSDLSLLVRDLPAPQPALTSQGLFEVEVEPPSPSLERLWEGQAEVRVLGPVGRQVSCRVVLYGRSGETHTTIVRLPPMQLPVSPSRWRSVFERHFRDERKVQREYDDSRACELEFSADELGACSIRCEREFTPLRWSVLRRGQKYYACLVDDFGGEEGPRVSLQGFETPTVQEHLSSANRYECPVSGGMYVARLGDIVAAAIVPPHGAMRGLDGLRCTPTIQVVRRSRQSIESLLRTAELWALAKLPGEFIAVLRKRDVLNGLASHIASLICGERWARAERLASKEGESGVRLVDAIGQRPREKAMAEAILGDCTDFADCTCLDRCLRVSSVASDSHLVFPKIGGNVEAPWWSELALRVASSPATVREWAGSDLDEGLRGLMDMPGLLRVARLLVFSVERIVDGRLSVRSQYSGWDWG